MDSGERERLQRQNRERELSEHAVDADPFEQFRTWFQDAQGCGVTEAEAMCLATADSEGRPSARYVLLKGFDNRGFVWYTNYESRKGQELDANPSAALVFWWKELGRSVRIEGTACRVSAVDSDEYFASRPLGSRVSASVSQQSRPISNRKELEERAAEFREKLEHSVVPQGVQQRPGFWGGYRLSPTSIEFWQSRRSRLHDRIKYVRSTDADQWRITRLQP